VQEHDARPIHPDLRHRQLLLVHPPSLTILNVERSFPVRARTLHLGLGCRWRGRYFTRRRTRLELAFMMYLFALVLGLKVTFTLYEPLRSFGRRTVTLPLAFAGSLTVFDREPNATLTLPAGLVTPATLTRTTTRARLLARTDRAFTVTLGLPFAILAVTAEVAVPVA